MKQLLTTLGFITLFAIALPAQAATPLEISGWLPYWREASSTADTAAHLSTFKEINPFGYVVQPDGTVKDMMGVADEPWKSLIAEAKKKKVRVIPTVMWSDGAAIHRILSNTETRIKLEDDITALAFRENFDGIEIDFEGKWAETRPYFSTFLRGLYQRMGKKWVMCAIESRTPLSSRYDGTPPPGAGDYSNDYVEIGKYCDRVKIMAYDQGAIDVKLNAAAKGAPYVPVADIRWVEKAMTVAAQSIPKSRLMIGVATYGYEYQVTPLSQQGYRYDLQWAFNPRYATELATEYGLTARRNSAGEMSFAYLPGVFQGPPANTESALLNGTGMATSSTVGTGATLSSGTFNMLSWSDATAIADKVALAKKMGLRGVAVFKIDGGEDPNIWNVLK